jgi:hypothetical protein
MSTFPETGTQPLILPVLSGDWVPCATCGAWVEVWHARWVPLPQAGGGQSGYWECDRCEDAEPVPVLAEVPRDWWEQTDA